MEEKKLKTKLELFNEDFSNPKNFEQNLEKLFQYIFSNIFPNILNLPRIDFINSLTSSVKAILEDQYSNQIYANNKFFSLFLSINKNFEKKYSEYNQLLSSSWDNYQTELYNMKKEEDIKIYKLTGFRKHCAKTQDYGIHNCNKNERGKYIIVFDKSNKNDKKFIICEKCRKSYYLNLFINYCQNCNCNYYCGLMSSSEDPNFLPATYLSPHCESIANDKISCTKCKNMLYYNINENILKCNNPSCKNKIIKPINVNWKCTLCSNYFKSDIKIFNNFELLYLKKIVGIALLVKEKGHPGILPCCKNLEENNIEFKHKKDCKGSLYFWLLNHKLIVICEKCKAINFFNRFIWTCPNCGLHFRAKKEEIEEKLKKSLFKNLKLNINMHILLGDEFLLNNNLKNDNKDNNIDNNSGYKMVRKKSFREILNMKKQEAFKNENKDKDIEQKYKTNEGEKEKDKEKDKENNLNINEENNDGIYIYRTNSKIKLNEEEVKSSMKKRKNYLFEKLLRNQFLPKNKILNSKGKGIKRNKSGAALSSEANNYQEEINKVLVSEQKLSKMRERSGSNYLKKNIKINNRFSSNKNIHDNIQNNNQIKDNENKLNNSDDAEKVNETSFIMEFNKKMNKNHNNNYISVNKKGLPPLPLKPKNEQMFIINEKKPDINIDEALNLDRKNKRNHKEKIIIDIKNININNKRLKKENDNNENNENEDKNKNIFNFEYNSENQSGYNTPRILIKNNSETDLKDSNKNSKNKDKNNIILKSNKNLILKPEFDLLNNEREKNGKIIQNLEDKFNEDYTQKKTKNKTDSNEDEEKIDEKDKIEKNDDNNEISNKNEEIKNNDEKEIKIIDNNNNNNIYYNSNENYKRNNNKRNHNNINIIYKNKDVKLFKNQENNGNNENKENKEKKKSPLLRRKQSKEKEEINQEKEEINQEKEIQQNNVFSTIPDDIISSSMFDSKIDIPIDNSTIQNDDILYSSIQRQIKKILSKGKLPQFNVDNYKIEKQIGEGSFGLIFEVVNKKTKLKYAMKKIIANNLNSLEVHQKEFEIVHQSSHPNILDILGICIRCLDQTTYVLYVLMDLAICDWDFEIEERKKIKKYYTENELISILKQIGSALAFLQKEKKIAHRDVKPENILVFKNGIYKLGDFGEAKINKLMKRNAKATIRGTEMYMSPLLFKSLQEDRDDVQHDVFKSDVFSLGYCLVFAASLDFKVIGDIRYINSDFKLKKILQRILFVRYSNDFIDLILKMICNKEEDRIDFIGLEEFLNKKHF